MASLVAKYNQLGAKQNIIQEGINDLKLILRNLEADQGAMATWGNVAIISNVVLVPLNCIVNSFQLGTARSVYEVVVRAVYERYAQSGTRAEGGTAKSLKILKKVTVSELKRRGLMHVVPGANILFGLAEDSIATFQAAQMVEGGKREVANLKSQLSNNISRMIQELDKMGVIRAQLFDRIERISRTV